MAGKSPPWFVRRDIDGFFGLFIDNLVQLLVIATLCPTVGGIPSEVVNRYILPGAAVSLIIGNLFYAWQARRLMIATGRDDVCALPYGINTPSVFAYLFLIIGPVYRNAVADGMAPDQAGRLAWQMGLFACMLSGVVEFFGAFVADWLRRHTPRAALLSALAGVAITFIAMTFVFRIFGSPLIAILPMMVLLVGYASGTRMPMGWPAGLVAVLLGTVIAWGLHLSGFDTWHPDGRIGISFYPPTPVIGDMIALLRDPKAWQYMSVIFPMGLFNLIGSLQNLESAEAAGDRYPTRSSLAVNGLGTFAAAMFGSCFPTTIYIGHPGWKNLGARAGYSVLNAVAITLLCVMGLVTAVQRFVPFEAALGILVWIGIIILAQSYQAVPKKHALAVSLGIIPALAAWAFVLIDSTITQARFAAANISAEAAAGLNLHDLNAALTRADFHVGGLIALNQGFLITCMIYAAVLVHIIDGRLLRAASWMFVAAVLSAIGLIHAYTLVPAGVLNKFMSFDSVTSLV
ncbi:MAG: hypothetical protein V3U29_02290, partial [Phycisphaeraceae bacterium]